MIEALAPLFKGPLEPFAECLTTDPVVGARPSAELLDPYVLRERIDRLALSYGDGDRRAVASIWSKHHFSTLMPAALAANLALDLELPVALAETRVVADFEGRTRRIVLSGAGTALALDQAEARFDALIDQHLEPLIAALAGVVDASPKIFWSNAGNVFDYVVRAAGHASPAAGVEAGIALMKERRRKGRPNPLYAPIRRLSDGRRVRRVCCLRYLTPRTDYCGTCPLPRGSSESLA